MNVWHSSDHHFHHANIIKYCSRPFASVEEMNEYMVEEWNKLVKPNDIVRYHGDFSLSRNKDIIIPFRQRLNGNWELFIAGNHDDGPWLHDPALASRLVIGSKNRKRRQGNAMYMTFDGTPLALSHYPINDWSIISQQSKAFNLHGHTHSTVSHQPGSRQIHIGVDSWNFRPVEWSEIRQIVDKY